MYVSPLISGVGDTFNCNRRLHFGQRRNGTLFILRLLTGMSTACGSVMHQSGPCLYPVTPLPLYVYQWNDERTRRIQ